MPFQSEKQRRYLWANEPEIARDWTDTYGSGIAKALGGRIPLANGNWLGNLYGQQEIADLEAQYGAGSAGLPSDARHQSAMSNLSDTLAGKTRSGVLGLGQPGKFSQFAGDIGAFGAGLIGEIPGIGRGIMGTAPWGEVGEDIVANWKGTFGTPYGKTSEDIYADVYGEDDDETGTIAFDPNNPQVNKAGLGIMSFLSSKFGPKIAAYLKNRALTKATTKTKAIIQQKKAAAARQAALRRQATAQSQVNRAAGTGGWQSGMAADTGFMSGKGTSAEMGSFNRGGLAWLR